MLSDADFARIRQIVYGMCWIDLNDGKRELVKARLAKRLRALGIDSYRSYVDFVLNDSTGRELSAMVDVLTTNLTSFFREPDHFTYLRQVILRDAVDKGQRRIRLWNAGCSTGEEAVSTAIVLSEAIPRIDSVDVSILATDVSSEALAMARKGLYPKQRFTNVSDFIRDKYFTKIGQNDEIFYRPIASLSGLISYRKHNLAGPWPMKGPFDAIFCRNVMIYFDKDAKQSLIRRFHRMLEPGGVLFVGHSESLINLTRGFEYVQPGVYRRT